MPGAFQPPQQGYEEDVGGWLMASILRVVLVRAALLWYYTNKNKDICFLEKNYKFVPRSYYG